MKNTKPITILHICHRDETSPQTAEILAKWTGCSVRSVPFLYDLPKHSDILVTLRQDTFPILVVTPISIRATTSLLHFFGITTPVLHYFGLESSDSDAVTTVATAVKTWMEQNSDSASEHDKLPDTSLPTDDIPVMATAMAETTAGTVEYLREFGTRRWYPLIDHTACTGCLECVNFCLFGVYSLTTDLLPQVENPDACRDGCPACARVCPGGAILFPLYPDDVIAGKVAAVLTPDRQDYHQADHLRNLHTTATTPNDTTRDVTKSDVHDDLDHLIDQTEWMQ